jgi:CheY-like chemotaxis protein
MLKRTGWKVAVADDEDIIRCVVARILRELGAEIVEARNGDELISLLRDQGPFDLVVTDHAMPCRTGTTVLCQLRAHGDQTPAILMSADMPITADEVVALGHIHLLEKPFGLDEFEAATRDALAA